MQIMILKTVLLEVMTKMGKLLSLRFPCSLRVMLLNLISMTCHFDPGMGCDEVSKKFLESGYFYEYS